MQQSTMLLILRSTKYNSFFSHSGFDF